MTRDPLARLLAPALRPNAHETLAATLLLEFRHRLRTLWTTSELLAALEGKRTPLAWEEGIGRLTLIYGQRVTERVALALVRSEIARRWAEGLAAARLGAGERQP